MTTPEPQTERRKFHAVRAIFEEALEHLEPFFNPAKTWGAGSMDHAAHVSMHERYPHLSQLELFVLVQAAKRYFSDHDFDQGN